MLLIGVGIQQEEVRERPGNENIGIEGCVRSVRKLQIESLRCRPEVL